MARVLADVTVAVHIAALLLIGFGGFVAWKWPKFIFLHVFLAIWGVLVNVFPIPCPLTALENHFRHQQGLGDLPGGFNAYYLYDTVFPRSMLPFIAVIGLVVVTISYVGAYQHWKHRGVAKDAPAHQLHLG